MFWNIFLSSLALIVAIMVIGQLIASSVEGKAKRKSEGGEQ